MKRNKFKLSKGGISQATAAVVGVIVAVLFSVLLTWVISYLVLKDNLGEEIGTGAIFAVRSISALVGTLIGGFFSKRAYLKLTGIVVVGYLFILLGTTIVFFDGKMENVLLGMVSALIGGAVALIILQAPKGKQYKHKKIAI